MLHRSNAEQFGRVRNVTKMSAERIYDTVFVWAMKTIEDCAERLICCPFETLDQSVLQQRPLNSVRFMSDRKQLSRP